MLQQKKSISIYFPAYNFLSIISLYPLSKIQKINALAKHFPVISVGDKPLSCHFDSVELDSRKQGHIMANYLLSLGHTDITYISTPIRGKKLEESTVLMVSNLVFVSMVSP